MIVEVIKRVSVIGKMSCDRLDSPAVVIQSLFQADSFPCSVASLGHTNLFKALDTSTYVEEPMATRNLTWASGKRKISASPHTLQPAHSPFKPIHRMYPGNKYDLEGIYTSKAIIGNNYGSF